MRRPSSKLFTDSTSPEVEELREKKMQDLQREMKEMELRQKILWDHICRLSRAQQKHRRHVANLEEEVRRNLPRCRSCGVPDIECQCTGGYTG